MYGMYPVSWSLFRRDTVMCGISRSSAERSSAPHSNPGCFHFEPWSMVRSRLGKLKKEWGAKWTNFHGPTEDWGPADWPTADSMAFKFISFGAECVYGATLHNFRRSTVYGPLRLHARTFVRTLAAACCMWCTRTINEFRDVLCVQRPRSCC